MINTKQNLKILATGVCTALVTWHVPKWMGLSEGLNGIIIRGMMTIASEELIYYITKDKNYRYAAGLGGAVSIVLYPLYRSFSEEKDSYRFETRVNGNISDLLKESNKRDPTLTNARLRDIKHVIENNFIGTIDMRRGGSVSKHLYVNGKSDNDIYLILNKSELSDLSPRDVIGKIGEILSNYINGEISTSRRAITLKFNEGDDIQLIPAIEIRDGYKISNGDNWINTYPYIHSEKLTEINQNCNGKVVPTIKIAKNLPEFEQLTSHHIASMAVEVFKKCPEDIPKTSSKENLRYFVEKSKYIIKNPIKDESGQSINVDEYLGEENSSERMNISYNLDDLSKKIIDADETRSVKQWKSILGLNN